MAEQLTVGTEAPNFDLTSTEDVVLMLRDEVPRMAVVLYFFADPSSDRVRQDLQALADAQRRLKQQATVIMGISGTKLDPLKQIQREMNLPFPLLVDDRDFAANYGIDAPEDGDADPALYLVGREQQVLWAQNPVPSVQAALGEIEAALRNAPSQLSNYPKTVVNRVVNWWVNKMRPSRVAP